MRRRKKFPEPSGRVVARGLIVGHQIERRRFAFLWSPLSLTLILLTLLMSPVNVALGHRLDPVLVRLFRFTFWLDTGFRMPKPGHPWPSPERK